MIRTRTLRRRAAPLAVFLLALAVFAGASWAMETPQTAVGFTPNHIFDQPCLVALEVLYVPTCPPCWIT